MVHIRDYSSNYRRARITECFQKLTHRTIWKRWKEPESLAVQQVLTCSTKKSKKCGIIHTQSYHSTQQWWCRRTLLYITNIALAILLWIPTIYKKYRRHFCYYRFLVFQRDYSIVRMFLHEAHSLHKKVNTIAMIRSQLFLIKLFWLP